MISVAMATYNGEQYLQEQLESLSNQTQLPDELIVCDDGSSDDTLKILKDFVKKAPFSVVVIENDHNLGVIRNFEKAIINCTGDIILFSDQDDVWFENKISAVFHVFETMGDDVQIMINDAVVVDHNLHLITESLFSNVVRYTGKNEEFISGCCTAIRKGFRDLCLMNESRMDMFDEGFHRVGRILNARYVYEHPLQYYRRHGGNLSNSRANAEKLSLYDRLLYFRNRFLSVSQQQNQYDKWLEDRYQEVLFVIEFMNIRPLFFDRSKMIEKKQILSGYADALRDRISLREKSMFNRLFWAFLFFFQKKYSMFSGPKSMLLDIIKW